MNHEKRVTLAKDRAKQHAFFQAHGARSPLS